MHMILILQKKHRIIVENKVDRIRRKSSGTFRSFFIFYTELGAINIICENTFFVSRHIIRAIIILCMACFFADAIGIYCMDTIADGVR